MPKQTAGLSLQDAWKEASTEEVVPATELETPGSVSTEPVQPSELEQPAVETPTKPGLFEGLEGENKTPAEQLESGLHEVTVDGEKLMVSLDELKSGYMRQAAFTQKTQELAREREENERAITLFNAYKEHPVATAQRLWEAARSGQPVDDQAPAKQSTENVDIEQIVNERVNAILENDPRIKSLETQRFIDEVNEVFAQIESDWNIDPVSDDDKAFVVDKAIEWGISDLEAVFAKLMHQRQRMQKQIENVESNSSARGYGGEQALGLKTPAPPAKFGSFRDALNDTLVSEGQSASDLEVAIANL